MNLFKSRYVCMALCALVGTLAHAVSIPQEVVITKASDSKTLTVRYSRARASLVELRVNGVSMGTRSVSDSEASGETNFTLDTAKLKEGDNAIEICLYDKEGKIVATQKTTVVMDRSATGPVFLNKPRAGDTVQSFVEISVGFKYEMKNAYVSFFVDDDFKALKNYPPYNFLWDTSKATNGWHEVEAWVVDENSATFKTQRLRVFVNNPSGHTERQDPTTNPAKTVEPTVSGNPVNTTVNSGSGQLRSLGSGQGQAVGPVKDLTALAVSTNNVEPKTSAASGTKPVANQGGVTMAQRVMLPTGRRNAGQKVVASKSGGSVATQKTAGVTKTSRKPNDQGLVARAEPATKAGRAAPISLNYGTRLPAIGTYPIYVNGELVKFDVMPRVTDGVALTPFRHLFEHVGGKVTWQNTTKTVGAEGLGQSISFRVGDDFAMLNGGKIDLERRVFIDSGRTVVPLSFVQRILNVDVQYDPTTKHVLITKAASK